MWTSVRTSVELESAQVSDMMDMKQGLECDG